MAGLHPTNEPPEPLLRKWLRLLKQFARGAGGMP